MSIIQSITTSTLILLACSNSGTKEIASSLTEPESDTSTPALTEYSKTLPLEKIKLPAGFKIDIYAEVENAREMALSPSGVVYVGNRDKGNVYAIKDTDGDFKADKKWVIASGF